MTQEGVMSPPVLAVSSNHAPCDFSSLCYNFIDSSLVFLLLRFWDWQLPRFQDHYEFKCFIDGVGECWLIKKLTLDKGKSSGLHITFLSLWHMENSELPFCACRDHDLGPLLEVHSSVLPLPLRPLNRVDSSKFRTSVIVHHGFSQISCQTYGLGELTWLCHEINHPRQ